MRRWQTRTGGLSRFNKLEARLTRDLLVAGISDAHDGLARGLLLAAYQATGVPAPVNLD